MLGIAAVVAVAATAFAYTAGWLSPHRITPQRVVTALQPPAGPALGHRRNHIKGICFTGTFTANGAGSALSKAMVFTQGSYPVVGRLNLAGGDPRMPDAMAQVRGFSFRITTPDGQEWRSAMIDAPAFAAATPDAFFHFISAAADKDPNAIKRYLGAHPETLRFVGWAKSHPRTESWTEDRFNSLNSFVFADAAGTKRVVRWSLLPANKPVILPPDELSKRAPDFLQQDIVQRVDAAPQHWELVVAVADAGDPTADPTKPWPANRRTVDVGTLTAQQIEAEADGPCRDINFDPAVLPSGMSTSDDGFPAARSAAYRVSFDRRMAEQKDYPHTAAGARQ
ncbi:catalase family peroxidase [Acidipila sp. EB88]|nr:catalase family peroxidase [Acidipila sp. EB88]